ncbi:MAG: DUF2958 domain-containing protein [Planctomycetota bacterium]
MNELLTDEIRRKLPPLYAGEHDTDPLVIVKFFTPWTHWTWCATEFDGEDIFFGLVDGFERELGYFSLGELQAIRGPGGLRIKRDEHFAPKRFSQVKAELGAFSTGVQLRRKDHGR